MRLRVLTYNMHKGFCFYSRQYVLAELREAVRSVNADLVFLQEVMGVHPPKWQGEHDIDSQFEFLADEIWSHYAYGKNAIYSEGHHGNAILSKYPIVKYDNINVSTNPLEKRGLLHAQIEIPGLAERLHLICLHLDLLERGRKQQMLNLIHRVNHEVSPAAPLIVAGDFNDWMQKFSDPLGEKLGMSESGVLYTGQHAPTFPSWKPFLALDRVYVRSFKIHDYQVLSGLPWRRMSDHAAVQVELEIMSGNGDKPAY
jgi:endonuclease/exonuclease/phosphatase family metal-dependent hydrolase